MPVVAEHTSMQSHGLSITAISLVSFRGIFCTNSQSGALRNGLRSVMRRLDLSQTYFVQQRTLSPVLQTVQMDHRLL